VNGELDLPQSLTYVNDEEDVNNEINDFHGLAKPSLPLMLGLVLALKMNFLLQKMITYVTHLTEKEGSDIRLLEKNRQI